MSVRQLAIASGVGDELREVLAAIFSAEVYPMSTFADDAAAAEGGLAKYGKGARDAFEAKLYGRKLHDLTTWLCHLIHAANLLEGGYLSLFMYSQARADKVRARFRDGLEAAQNDRVCLVGSDLEITYRDGSYVLHLSGVSHLFALFDLILEACFDRVIDTFDQAAAGPDTLAQVYDLSNEIQTPLTAYLERQLPKRQASRKLQSVVEFLEDQPDLSAGPDSLSDRMIFAFWEGAQGSGLEDFRTYVSAFESCTAFARAMEVGASIHDLENARSIEVARGDDSSDRAVSVETLSTQLEAYEEIADWLTVLADSEVRYLSSEDQRKELSLLLSHQDKLSRIRLSLLRLLVFGRHQFRIINELRGKSAQDGALALAEQAPDESYVETVERFELHVENLIRTSLASAHVLLEHGEPEALHLIWTRLDRDLLSSLDEGSDFAASLTAAQFQDWLALDDTLGREALNKLMALLRGGSESVAPLKAQLVQAFAKVNRRGFRSQDLDDPEIVQAHAEGAAPLAAVCEHCARARQALCTPPAGEADWTSPFEQDVPEFRRLFKRIYGEFT